MVCIYIYLYVYLSLYPIHSEHNSIQFEEGFEIVANYDYRCGENEEPSSSRQKSHATAHMMALQRKKAESELDCYIV